MDSTAAKQRPPLLPDRMEQTDFFVCDIFDAAPKSDMASMEHPIFSLSTKPDYKTREYENGLHFLKVKPSSDGLATVHDRDVLIFCISQVMAAINEGREISQILRIKAYDLLRSTNRGFDGRGYDQLRAALARLRGTTIETNIISGGLEVLDGFGLIDSYRVVRETRDGRMQLVEIKLSDWVFGAIQAKEVLTINRDYFRLRKPLERRLYEIGRKHCGQKPEWSIGLEKLQEKCGSSSTKREFRRLVQKIVAEDHEHSHMPDYGVRFDVDRDQLTFFKRGVLSGHAVSAIDAIRLKPETHTAAKAAAPQWDIYGLEEEWREWMSTLDTLPDNPDAAFIGFCASVYAKRGAPA